MTGRYAYISYKPDFITDWERSPNYAEIYKNWVENSADNDADDLNRLFFLILQIENLKERNIDEAVAELGVYKGTTAKFFRQLMPESKLVLFDTFEGFAPEDVINENETATANAGTYLATLAQVKAYLSFDTNVEYVVGRFPDSVKNFEDNNSYALVHIDADLYAPQLAGMEYFYPRMQQGGLLIIHDCNNYYQGSRKALDEFFAYKPETPVFIPDKSGSALVVKI